ncbi:PDZ domain-containing RING finger protein 4, partial [Acromyrmex echinatior]
EVTLRKSGSAEKLGLTVCYSSGSGSEDLDTEIYISEIVPESLAARDGRLREGDQILQGATQECKTRKTKLEKSFDIGTKPTLRKPASCVRSTSDLNKG